MQHSFTAVRTRAAFAGDQGRELIARMNLPFGLMIGLVRVVVSLVMISVMIMCVGCQTVYQLHMDRYRTAYDNSSLSNRNGAPIVHTLMILPEDNQSEHAVFIADLAELEQELIRNAFRVVSPGILARNANDDKSQNDLERALVMARSLNVDAILQVGANTQSARDVPTRFFVRPATSLNYVEVDEADYNSSSDIKRVFESRSHSFVAKLIRVSDAEQIMAIEIRSAENWNLPGDYVATMTEFAERIGDREVVMSLPLRESFHYDGAVWRERASIATRQEIVRTIARLILQWNR